MFGPCFFTVVLGVLSSFAIISLRKRKLVALPNMSSCCHVGLLDKQSECEFFYSIKMKCI